jgi:transposase
MAAKNDNKRRVAREFYVTHGYTARQISEFIKVSEITLSRWVNNYGWKQQREAAVMAPGERSANIDQIISLFAQERIILTGDVKAEESKREPDPAVLKDLRERMSKIDAAVANWNKTRETAKKDERIPLEVYIKIMEEIFDAMRVYSLELFMQTVAFQDHHRYEISIR